MVCVSDPVVAVARPASPVLCNLVVATWELGVGIQHTEAVLVELAGCALDTPGKVIVGHPPVPAFLTFAFVCPLVVLTNTAAITRALQCPLDRTIGAKIARGLVGVDHFRFFTQLALAIVLQPLVLATWRKTAATRTKVDCSSDLGPVNHVAQTTKTTISVGYNSSFSLLLSIVGLTRLPNIRVGRELTRTIHVPPVLSCVARARAIREIDSINILADAHPVPYV